MDFSTDDFMWKHLANSVLITIIKDFVLALHSRFQHNSWKILVLKGQNTRMLTALARSCVLGLGSANSLLHTGSNERNCGLISL